MMAAEIKKPEMCNEYNSVTANQKRDVKIMHKSFVAV
jgi:hypothetical protein